MKNTDELKRKVIVWNVVLLGWFFLDMVGVWWQDYVLVTRSYSTDGVFFVVMFVGFLLFLFWKKYGVIILALLLGMWLMLQAYFHWYFTLFGPSQGKMNYFKDTIKLFSVPNRYIPDLYHIVLHVLIVYTLYHVLTYIRNNYRNTASD